jgi:bacteriocin-like protein
MTEKNRTEHLRDSRELTVDELEQVSGGAPRKAGGSSQEYLEIKLKEVFITSV